MNIQEFPSYTASSNKVGEAVLTNITLVADVDKKFQYGPKNYNITMIPPLVCSKIKYNIVRNILLGDYPLGETSEETFDDMAKSLMEYSYVLPLNGLHFIVHQQSPLLIIQPVDLRCRSTLPLFDRMFNEYQIKTLSPKYSEMVICNMYFPRIPITLNSVIIEMPERITFECRKSDTLWMLVSARLSMGLSLTSMDREYVVRVIAAINAYMKSFIHNTQLLNPVVDNDPMAVNPRMVKINNAITSLCAMPKEVLNYKRNLLARWYDIYYHSMLNVFLNDVSDIPHFREIKIYYNCNLNREEYIQAGYLVGVKFDQPRKLPRAIHTAPLHSRAGSKVGRKTAILADDRLPDVCKIGNDVIRPDRLFDWNGEAINGHDNAMRWLGQHNDYTNIQYLWQFVNIRTPADEYPTNPVKDNVPPLSQFVEFWSYYLPDNRKEIMTLLFRNQFMPVTVHNYLMEVFNDDKDFNYI
jgi:hypothetical protein